MARPPDPLVGDGLLLVDKSAGMTSHDVVGACRRICGTRKVGHAGTLDPSATGLLLVGVNKATRFLTFLVGCDKTYDATIRLGRATITDDSQGEETSATDADHLSDGLIAAAIAGLTGDIAQVPSAVSAIKVAGVRSYARVRGGESVSLPARPVQVSRFHVHARRDGADLPATGDRETSYVDLDVTVAVSSGTYIRALARDLGDALGVGGHLTALRRTRVGAFDVTAAHDLDRLTMARQSAEQGTSGLPLIPLPDVAAAVLPGRFLDESTARRLAHGVRIASAEPGRSTVAAYGPSGELIAVIDESEEIVSVTAVFANDWSRTS